MKVEHLRQTCSACPSQWEFRTDEGHMVYVRYRWGFLSVSVSLEPTDNVYDAVGGLVIYGEQLQDDGLDGVIAWSEVHELIKDIDVLGALALAKKCEEEDGKTEEEGREEGEEETRA